MTSLLRRVVAPALVVAACVGVATTLAVPEEPLDDDLTADEVARIDRFVDRFRHGQRMLGQGRDDLAEEIFRDLLAEEPEAAAVHHALGTLLRFRKRPDAATASLLRAAELAPADAVIQRDAGIDLVQRSRPADAEPYFRRAREASPEDVEVLVLHGTALRALGRADEARAAYRAALAVQSYSVDASVGLAAMIVDAQPAEALELVEELPHGFADVALVHGLALVRLDRADEAHEHLWTAARRSPPGPAGLGIAAQAARTLGDVVAGDVAVRAAQRWCELSGEPAKLAPASFLAQALVATGRVDDAVAVLDAADAEGCEPALLHRAFLVRTAVLQRVGRDDDARRTLTALAEADVESPERALAAYVLGRIERDALVAALGTQSARRNDAAWADALRARLAGDVEAARRHEVSTRRLSKPAGEFPGLLVTPPPSDAR